jgi:hypothetical protein
MNNKFKLLQNIFKNHYSEFKKYHFKKLPSEFQDSLEHHVPLFLTCKDPEHGYAKYLCESCMHPHIVTFSCKSRLCSSCGKKYSENWLLYNKTSLLERPHRHITFTIPKEFRIHIFKSIKIIKELFQAIASTIRYMFKKTEIIKDAFIIVLHTFGRALNFNPHFHCVVAEGGFNNNGKFIDFSFFPYDLLRKSWLKTFTDTVKKHFNNSQEVKKMVDKLYKTKKDGLYVHAEQKLHSKKEGVLKYIGRYLSRPPLALYNLISYDENTKMVTFRYVEHKTGKECTETVEATKFIGLLAYHLMPLHFKIIRRYGAYARVKGRFKLFIQKLTTAGRQLFHRKKKRYTYAELLIKKYKTNPMVCPKCASSMFLYYIGSKKYGKIYSFEDDLIPYFP